jgi:hypothetical protein
MFAQKLAEYVSIELRIRSRARYSADIRQHRYAVRAKQFEHFFI